MMYLRPDGFYQFDEEKEGSPTGVRLYTEEEIKEAFYTKFHLSGEHFFNYLGTERENDDSTEWDWNDFLETLTR